MVPTHAAGQPIGLEAILNSFGTVFFSVVVALAAGLLVLAFLGDRVLGVPDARREQAGSELVSEPARP